MKGKKLLVVFCIFLLLVDSIIVLGSDNRNKKDKQEKNKEKSTSDNKRNEKEKKSKEQDTGSNKSESKEEKTEKSDDKEKKVKDKENKGNNENDDKSSTKGEKPEHPATESKPYGVHGPGEGTYDTGVGKWSGAVWAHYDYNPTFKEWEVGIEGLTLEGETAWYAFSLVESENMKKNTFTATGFFTGMDEPLTGLAFTYIADLESMSWELYGDGYYFSGTIQDIVYDEQNGEDLLGSSKPVFQAKGTIDSYMDVYSAELLWGRWMITLRNGEIKYSAMYKERNLEEAIESSPVDSVDIFWHSFTVEDYTFDGETLWFRGILHVEKLWSKPDGTKQKTSWSTYPVTIIIDSTSFYLDSPPEGEGLGVYDQDWDRAGTTTLVIQ